MTTITMTPPILREPWEEADLLRAAGIISRMLADHEWVAWRCVALGVLDLAGSVPRSYDLAYAALKTYLADAPCDLAGETGDRMVRLRMAMVEAVAVDCPACPSRVGDPCVMMRKGKPIRSTLKWPHAEREQAVIEREAAEWCEEHSGSELDARLARER